MLRGIEFGRVAATLAEGHAGRVVEVDGRNAGLVARVERLERELAEERAGRSV